MATTAGWRVRRAPLAEVALIGMASVWGLTFVMVQDAIEVLPALTFLGYRFAFAAAAVAVAFRNDLRVLGRDGWRAGVVMGIFLTAGYVFQTLGLERTTASNAGFITGLWVVLTPLFGALFFGQRLGPLAIGAAAASTVGLLLLSGAGRDVHMVGDLLVFVCAIAFTFHIFATDAGVRDHPVGALVAVQILVCAVVNLVLAAGAGDLQIPRGAVVWNALIVTSLVASALGFFVQTYAQQHAPPARTALILASEPAFAGLFAWLLAGETLSGWGWIGAGLILGSIVVVEAVPYLRRVPPAPEG